MSTTTAVHLVGLDERAGKATDGIAIAGFLAGYCGATRTSYATDLRLFATWCEDQN